MSDGDEDHVARAPERTSEQARTEFNAEQFANPYPDGIQHHYWTLARNRLILRTLRSRRMQSESDARAADDVVLDIGCGRGITVEFLRRHGVNAIGADMGTPAPITPDVAPFLHLGQDAMAMPAAFRRQVRTILLLDVLEHIAEPAAFVAALAGAFERCTHLLITVPARQELWSNYDTYYGHFRRYDLRSARSLYPNELFELTSATYAFRLLYAPALVLAAMSRNRSVSISAPTPAMRPVHRLLAAYFGAESAILPRWVPGSSLVLTLRRR